MNFGGDQSPTESSTVNKRTVHVSQNSDFDMLINTSPTFRQRQKDKDHLREITAQLQSFVRKKRNLEAKNKLLRTEVHVMERDNIKRIARVTKTYEDKARTIKSENEIIKQELEALRVRLHNAEQSKHDAEQKRNKAYEEKDFYETQLPEIQKKLVVSNAEVEKLRATIGRLDRERNKQKEEASSIRSQNTTLIIQKTSLEEKLRNGSMITQKHQGNLEQLRKKISQEKKLHAAQVAEMRHKFKLEKENIQRQFKEKLDAFCKKRGEQYDKDKETWMHIFRKEVETKMRGLSETNQCLGHNAKVLEEKNEECKGIISSLSQEMTKVAKDRDRAIKARHDLEAKLDEVQKAAEKRVQELERTTSRYQREHEKMKQVLIKKDNKLLQLEKEQVDYFQEINTFQQLLATADENSDPKNVSMRVRVSPRLGISYENSADRNTKKRRLCESTVVSPSVIQTVEPIEAANATEEKGTLGFSIVDLEQGFFVLKNRSQSTSISLKGYHVTNSTEPICRRDLPEITLLPNEEIRVLYGAHWSSSAEVLKNDIVWKGVWANEKDAIILWNSEKEMVANYKFELADINKNCSLM